MHFLVVDNRFVTPIHVILEADPSGERDFPDLKVREITLEERVGPGAAVGRHPRDAGGLRTDRTALRRSELVLLSFRVPTGRRKTPQANAQVGPRRRATRAFHSAASNSIVTDTK